MRSMIFFIAAIYFSLFSYSKGQIIDTPYGKAEILGLNSWSLHQLLDTLSIKAPGKSIDRCAAILKRIGFPDASVYRYFNKDGKFYSVVTIVEPQFANFIRYKKIPSDTLNELPAWSDGIQFFKNNPMEFQVGLSNYNSHKFFEDSSKRLQHLNKEKNRELWKFISNHQTEHDKELAIWILNKDGNFINRVIAVSLLINFPESDFVWWNLIDALRDPDARVSTTAMQVLEYFSKNNPRKINWYPSVNSLFYLINGTNLFAFKTVLKVLTITNMSEQLMPKLFSKSNGYLLLSYLKSEHETEKNLAYEFLVKISGKNFRNDQLLKWQDYLKSFSK